VIGSAAQKSAPNAGAGRRIAPYVGARIAPGGGFAGALEAHVP
jgi:hypothetical protein